MTKVFKAKIYHSIIVGENRNVSQASSRSRACRLPPAGASHPSWTAPSSNRGRFVPTKRIASAGQWRPGVPQKKCQSQIAIIIDCHWSIITLWCPILLELQQGNAFAPAASRLAWAANSFASFSLFFRKVFTYPGTQGDAGKGTSHAGQQDMVQTISIGTYNINNLIY